MPISKNQLKKLKREEKWLQKKEDYKRYQKEKKKLCKQKKKEIEESLKLSNPELYQQLYPNNSQTVINPPKKEVKKQYLENMQKGVKIIIDCGFEKYMKEKDLISLTRQLTDCYSINKKAENPFNFILYDVGENLKNNLLKNNCEKWLGFRFIEVGKYDNLKEFIKAEFTINENSFDNSTAEENTLQTCEKKFDYKCENIVYLTGDSENEINSLDKNKIFIIGGLVDRNKLKLITYNKAKELGISHGKLPIGDFIHLKTSKILATNHVFAILSHFVNKSNDWKECFTSIIPKRKLEESEESMNEHSLND